MDRGAWWATVIEVAESDTAEQLHFKLLYHSFFFFPLSVPKEITLHLMDKICFVDFITKLIPHIRYTYLAHSTY